MDLDFGSAMPSRRLPIYLLVDTSDSMIGEPIQLACQTMSLLHHELMNIPDTIETAWLSVITFGGTVQQLVPLTELAEFTPPELSIEGTAKLGAAFRALNDALHREMRPNRPDQKGDYRASIFLLLGSESADSWQDEVKTLHSNQYIASFVTLLCKDNINVSHLQQRITNVLAAKDFAKRKVIRQFVRFISQPTATVLHKGPTHRKISRSQMREVSATMTVAPFGKINYWDLPDENIRMVRATILTDFVEERAKLGLGIDGSRSMRPHFESGYLMDVVQRLGAFLARRDWDGTVSLIYWATGAGNSGIQSLGDFSKELIFPPPESYGDRTYLLPALKYFTDGVQRPDLYHAEWGVFVFLTDGAIEDLAAVKRYSTQLAKDLSEGRRLGKIKLLLLGLGGRVDQAQFDALDDLETGTEIDLWDTMLLSEIRELDNPYKLFSEIADPDYIFAPGDGIVRNNYGNVVADFREPGLPAVLEFNLSFGEPAFDLEVADEFIHQPLPFAARGLDQDSWLNIYPLDIDFGFVDNLDQEHTRTISIRNNGVGIWIGTAEPDVAWLSVSPAQLECPPAETIELHVRLKPGAEFHLGPKLNMGLITVSGAGFEARIRVTVAIRFRFMAFSTAEADVMDMWNFIHDNLDQSAMLLQERFKDLVRRFCDRVGLVNLSDPPKLTGEFCRFTLDVSTVFRDTGWMAQSPLVCSLFPELRDDHLPELDILARDYDLPGHRLVMLLILFGERTAVQEAYARVMALSYRRTYDVVVLGGRELWQIVYNQDPRKALRTQVLRGVNLETVNPFQTAGPADDITFTGREFELSIIAGNVQEKSYAIVGGRRIGKTSLLLQLHRKSLPAVGLRALFYDCGFSLYQDFLDSTPVDWSPGPPVHTPHTFRELFASPPVNGPLVILLDEIDELIAGDAPAGWPLFKMVRALVNSRQIQIVACGAGRLRQALRDAYSPLYNLAQNTFSLKRLDYPAVKELVTRPMRQLEIALDHEKKIIDLIWQHTGGHPRAVQGLCAKLIERLSRQPGDIMTQRRITPDDVKAIVQNPKFLTEDFLDVYWEQATYLERIIVLALAQVEEQSRNSLETHGLLRERVGLDLKLREVELPLDRLTELRCILKKSSQGYAFDVKAFPRVLRQSNVINIEVLLKRYLEDYQDYGDVQLRSRWETNR